MLSVRICLFLLLFGLWFWASSIFTPWATSTDPKLWLYDLLFYTRFVLLFWGAVELMLARQLIRNKPQQRKRGLATISVVAIAAFTALAYTYLMTSGNGFHARAEMSSAALEALRTPGFSDRRQRAGWFLVDTQRQPCGDQPWLWLGNAHGGGTGNNLALVYSEKAVPKTPIVEAFRFWHVTDHWWLAYQNPKSYHSLINEVTACEAGETVGTHEQGMKFIKATLSDDTLTPRK